MESPLPPRCVGRCPLEGAPIEGKPLVVSRNCQGPAYRDGNTDELIVQYKISDEGLIGTSAVTSSCRIVCRNKGLNLSLDALVEAGMVESQSQQGTYRLDISD